MVLIAILVFDDKIDCWRFPWCCTRRWRPDKQVSEIKSRLNITQDVLESDVGSSVERPLSCFFEPNKIKLTEALEIFMYVVSSSAVWQVGNVCSNRRPLAPFFGVAVKAAMALIADLDCS